MHDLRFKLEYHSASGEVINLSDFPFYWNETDIRSYDWSFESVKKPIGYGSRINKLTRSVISKTVEILVKSDKENIYDLIDDLSSAFERDVANMTPGRLYVNDYYIKGYVTGLETVQMIRDSFNRIKLTISAEYPMWIKENRVMLPIYPKDIAYETIENMTYEQLEGMTYEELTEEVFEGFVFPARFPFNFVATFGSVQIKNEHYAPTGAIIKFYGPAENPTITIGANIYRVNTVIGSAERIEINQLDRTIQKITQSGDVVNMFSFRNKEQSIFEYIPSGDNVAFYNGEYPIEIILLEERSMPKWN